MATVALLGLSAYKSADLLLSWTHGLASDNVTGLWTFHLDAATYAAPAYGFTSHEYAPIVAQVLAPLTALSFEQFRIVWMAVQLAILLWIVGPRLLGLVLLIPLVWGAVWSGNIQNLYALVVGLGLTYPALWAIPLLTKITPGIGLLWFAVRQEWRNLAIALGTTAALVLVSGAIVPWAWADWFGFLTRGDALPTSEALPLPLWVRLGLSVGLVVWGARTNRAWVLGPVLWLAMPQAWWNGVLVILASFRLRGWRPVGPALVASS